MGWDAMLKSAHSKRRVAVAAARRRRAAVATQPHGGLRGRRLSKPHLRAPDMLLVAAGLTASLQGLETVAPPWERLKTSAQGAPAR